MKSIIFGLLLIILTSCATPTPSPDLEVYKDRFATEYEARVGKQIPLWFWGIEIGFVSSFSDKRALGMCYYVDTHIEISKAQWDTKLNNDLIREYVIFHELGHCFLDLDHTEEFSMMQPYIMPMRVYDRHRHELLNQLFTGVFR